MRTPGTVPVVPERSQNNDTPAQGNQGSRPIRARHPSLDHGREARITRLCLAFTLVCWATATTVFAETLWRQLSAQAAPFDAAGTLLFTILFSGLIYGGVVYHLARLGYLRRRAQHVPADRETLERCFDDERAPAVTVLVPSYKEEPEVVRCALLSAALQDYPHRRVVLLLDDPPAPSTAEDAKRLACTRALPHEIASLLRPQAARFAAEYQGFLRRWNTRHLDRVAETRRLAHLCREASDWFEAQTSGYPAGDHHTGLLTRLTFKSARDDHLRRAEALERRAEAGGLGEADLLREYRRLNHLLHVEFACFERKRYVNLPHEANKAMNLNGYIALMGRSFREVMKPDGLHLERCLPAEATLRVPDTDYLITLDADSLLAPDYAARLIHLMQQPGNERLAVAQTPYSVIPGAPGLLERIAGATTDIQCLLHQGFTAYDATYWVGANALLRVSALRDIVCDDSERGFPVKKFIQDRTVIEDTESSVGLVARGWRLYNYPGRLAYSATPPDFGALVIQRRRWANGGLIILPKLLRYLATRARRPVMEGFIRTHYLASPALANAGLLLLLALPFGEDRLIVWVPLAAAPYFLLYARDLAQIGYRASDALRVYALNLLLIPVNLGGVLKSLHQAATGRKTPFARTPKVTGRTAVPALYAAAPLLLFGLWLIGAGVSAWQGYGVLAACGLVNAAFLAYAIRTFVGRQECRAGFVREQDSSSVPSGLSSTARAGKPIHARA
ncbi:MAG: glycosyl transferase [Gammaproteobacteria bacterium]|nr:MAG: glycosyl transferase [Gammaproteobacteria bacterium]